MAPCKPEVSKRVSARSKRSNEPPVEEQGFDPGSGMSAPKDDLKNDDDVTIVGEVKHKNTSNQPEMTGQKRKRKTAGLKNEIHKCAKSHLDNLTTDIAEMFAEQLTKGVEEATAQSQSNFQKSRKQVNDLVKEKRKNDEQLTKAKKDLADFQTKYHNLRGEKSILSTTTSNGLSPDCIRAEMESVSNGFRNWSFNACMTKKRAVSLSKLSQEQSNSIASAIDCPYESLRAKPDYTCYAIAGHALFEILWTNFRDSGLYGPFSQLIDAFTSEEAIHSTFQKVDEWRSMTISLLSKNSSSSQDSYVFQSEIYEATDRVNSLTEALLGGPTESAVREELQEMMHKAFQFVLKLLSQPERYEFEFLGGQSIKGYLRDPKRVKVDDRLDTTGENLLEKKLLTYFPSLIRWSSDGSESTPITPAIVGFVDQPAGYTVAEKTADENRRSGTRSESAGKYSDAAESEKAVQTEPWKAFVKSEEWDDAQANHSERF